LGWQPIASQNFQPLSLQTLTLVDAAIYCVLSEYSSGKKSAVMVSQGQYQGTFWPFPVLNVTPEATAAISFTVEGRFISPSAVQLC